MASIASSNSNGASVSYTYDSLNRLSMAVDSRLGSTTYTYDPANNVTTATYPNGVQTTFAYDALNRTTGVATSSSGFVYQLGPTGNKTSALELSVRRNHSLHPPRFEGFASGCETVQPHLTISTFSRFCRPPVSL